MNGRRHSQEQDSQTDPALSEFRLFLRYRTEFGNEGRNRREEGESDEGNRLLVAGNSMVAGSKLELEADG